MKRNVVNKLIILISIMASPGAGAQDSGPKQITNQRGSAVIFSPASSDPEVINSYIVSRHRLLARLTDEQPEGEFEAQISFVRYLLAEELLEILGSSSLEVIALNFGWDGQSGGFDLRPEESIEDGLARLHRYHGDFINQLHDEPEQSINIESMVGDHINERRQWYSSHVQKLTNSYRNRGVLFFGMRAKGDIMAMKTFSKNTEKVRLVDVLWDELSDASGITGIKKIAVPITPGYE